MSSPEAPEVGSCWAEPPDDILHRGLDLQPVPCSEPHRAVRLGAEELRDWRKGVVAPFVTGSKPITPARRDHLDTLERGVCTASSMAIRSEYWPTSGVAVYAYRRDKLRRSLVLPTLDQWKAGARWVSCQFATDDGTDFSLEDIRELAYGEVPADLALCVTQDGGSPWGDRDEDVACDDPAAAWQVIATFEISTDEEPTDAATWRTLVDVELPRACRTMTEAMVGSTEGRPVHVFAPRRWQDHEGAFTCAVAAPAEDQAPLGG